MAIDKDLLTKEELKELNKKSLILKAKVLGITAAVLAVIIGVVSLVSSMREKQEQDRVRNIVAGIKTDTLTLESDYYISNDDDNDGINNGTEEKLSTNYQEQDTDKDGISDGDEVNVGTDPTKNDTDGDGVLDGYELILGLDPQKASSDGSTQDGQRVFDIERTYNNVTLKVSGNANISDTVFDNLDLVGFKSNMAILSDAISFYTDYTFTKASICFNVDFKELMANGAKANDVSIYRFDPATSEFVQVESVVDEANGTISADIDKCATYMLGKVSAIGEAPIMRVQLLIDNSGSMYPEEMCAGSEENDVNFKRLDLSQNIIDMLAEGSLVGISKFTATYTEMVEFTTDKKELGEALDRIKNEDEIFNGTDFEGAVMHAIEEFDVTEGNYSNMIIMLCDGHSDSDKTVEPQAIIDAANEKNIIILTIGLGQKVNAPRMQKIAEGTGGRYYTAADAEALDEVFTQIETTFNYDIISYGKEGKSGYSIANTGFAPALNGFSFQNFRTTSSNGTCFGMAMFARDWYTGSLNTKLDEYKPETDSKNVFKAQGYDLTGTSILEAYNSHKTLSELTANAIKTNEFNDLEDYLNFEVENATMLPVKQDVLSKATAKGYGTVNYDIKDLGLDWLYVQLLAIDVEKNSAAIESAYGKDEAELYKALLRHHVLLWQETDKNMIKLAEGKKCFDTIEERLSEGIPCVLLINDTHAVNAISLIQDADCPRRFILQVYDNNFPGEIREITIERIVTGSFDENGQSTGISYRYAAVYDSLDIALTLCDTPTV